MWLKVEAGLLSSFRGSGSGLPPASSTLFVPYLSEQFHGVVAHL